MSSNADGDLVVAWLHDGLVSAKVRPHGGIWKTARTWRPGPGDEQVPFLNGVQAAIGAEGRALVIWNSADVWSEARHRYENYVAWARSTPSGTWSPGRTLTKALGEDGGGLTLSMNSTGTALASWYQNVTTDTPSRVWAARFRPDGTWGVPLRVSWREAHRTSPFMDDRGKAQVVIQSGQRILAFEQRPSHPWDVGRRIATGHLFDARGCGRRFTALYERRSDGVLLAVTRTGPR